MPEGSWIAETLAINFLKTIAKKYSRHLSSST